MRYEEAHQLVCDRFAGLSLEEQLEAIAGEVHKTQRRDWRGLEEFLSWFESKKKDISPFTVWALQCVLTDFLTQKAEAVFLETEAETLAFEREDEDAEYERSVGK